MIPMVPTIKKKCMPNSSQQTENIFWNLQESFQAGILLKTLVFFTTEPKVLATYNFGYVMLV